MCAITSTITWVGRKNRVAAPLGSTYDQAMPRCAAHNCGNRVPPEARFCPRCGRQVQHRVSMTWIASVVLLALFILTFLLVGAASVVSPRRPHYPPEVQKIIDGTVGGGHGGPRRILPTPPGHW